jgi:cyclophilin family peptidyl-prolyl cis-trans isomerase
MIKKIFPIILALLTLSNLSCIAQKKEKQTRILLSTSYGDIKMVLYNETPQHRDNFIKLVKDEFFNGTLFHRVIKGFMIQGGDPESKNAKPDQMLGNGGPGYTVPAEFNAKFIHKKGALSAARLGDGGNPKKASSGSQFYVVQGKITTPAELEQIGKRNGITYTAEQIKEYGTTGGTPFLDMNYTVFGEVIEGFDVIDKIAAVKKGRGDRPVEDVAMTLKIVKK